ncbi:MAG TPA: hypothetical protein H9836_15835 [Candidatus Nocardiopsis merdipullorum]|nr:hypothetical protein [Candidatus Nocardiopsis merdipullorum]
MENSTALKPGLVNLTSEALRAEADALAFEEAPRRFAVFAMNEEEQDAVILAWGQHFNDGHVALTGDATPVRGSFCSLHSALRVCGLGNTAIHVTWIDPEPIENRPTACEPLAITGTEEVLGPLSNS